MGQFRIKSKPVFNRKQYVGKMTNADGKGKISPIVPHHQAVVTGEEWIEHIIHLPKSIDLGDGESLLLLSPEMKLGFMRYHFKDEDEAESCLTALKVAGGFGVRIKKSIRIVRHWEDTMLRILPQFETGPVEHDGDSTIPYDNPQDHEERLW